MRAGLKPELQARTEQNSGRNRTRLPLQIAPILALLLDDPGPGSLRAAIDTAGPRIVIFEVSGTITLSSNLQITSPSITIAGQTAPSPGITLRAGSALTSTGEGILDIRTHDVLVQHLRLRAGDLGPSGNQPDALSITGGDAYNVVIDHCSLSWGIDEVVSTQSAPHDITVSNSIIVEGLDLSDHPVGPHSMGIQVGEGTRSVALLRNLVAHARARNPYFKGDTTGIFVNNVVYNWGYQPTRFQDRPGYGPTSASIVGNTYVQGGDSSSAFVVQIDSDVKPDSQLYVFDNSLNRATPPDPWTLVDNKIGDSVKAAKPPVWVGSLAVLPVGAVETDVLANAGARPADRDAVDLRIVGEVQNGTGRIINSQDEVGGWPVLAENIRPLTVPANPHGDDDADGYTNVEEWLHQFAAAVESPDTTPPTVALTAPAESTTFTAAQTVTITADAFDTAGVTGVDFYDGPTLLGRDTTAPHSFNWAITMADNGPHSLTARASDARGNRATSAAVRVTVHIPPAPPSVLETEVSASADDAEEKGDGSVTLASTDLELVTSTSVQTVGIRFSRVTIPQGATITAAYVRFTTDETGSGTITLALAGQAADSAPAFTTNSWNISSRPRTAATAAWAPPAWTTVGEAGPDQRTPDLRALIQEIVSRPGWASGNALAIIITGSGKRVAKAYDGSHSGAPVLHVEYTVP